MNLCTDNAVMGAIALEKIKRKRKCEMLEGEPPAQVEALMAYLKRKGALY